MWPDRQPLARPYDDRLAQVNLFDRDFHGLFVPPQSDTARAQFEDLAQLAMRARKGNRLQRFADHSDQDDLGSDPVFSQQ